MEGYVSNVAKQKEIGLNTNSTGFDMTGPKQFKRFGADSHAGISPHVHQPIRNTTPRGPRGTTGSKKMVVLRLLRKKTLNNFTII
ncbi:hypothetical protein VHTUMSATKI_35000 [Vibrio harveyi]|uniref:hypothetical protein n=1 Tax=Vibrio harveyi TaxID=669 RepID=UPI0036F32AB2